MFCNFKSTPTNIATISNYIKTITQAHSLPPVMHLDNLSYSDNVGKANIFNKYFYSVFSTFTSNNNLPAGIPPVNCLNNIRFSAMDVCRALTKLDESKAMGIDGVSPHILKNCAGALYTPIHHLFAQSLLHGKLPREWKTHLITPVFKSGDRSSVKNYRPISLLCSLSKVLERLVFDQMIIFLSPKISITQFGFLKGKSTQQQLLLIVNLVSNNLDKNLATDIAYLDLRKAFDTVPHGLLLHKLHAIGISGLLYTWLSDYLSNRTQVVSVKGVLSSTLEVLSGVPQGSILGPLLFLLFINDLSVTVKYSLSLLFADDTKCALTCNPTFASNQNLQEDLDMLGQWCSKNGMSFNEKKSFILRISNKPLSPSYTINSVPLLAASAHKDLGVTFSSDFSWSNHISTIVKNAYKTLGLIRRSFSASVDTRTRRDLYLYLVRSQLLYCSLIWRPYLIKEIKLLEQVQRRATKYILNDYVSDYKTRLSSLNMLPLMMVLELNDLSFFIKAIGKPSPSFDISSYIKFSDSSTRSSSHSKLLYTCPFSSKTRHSYFNRLPRLWNRLPYTDPNLSAASAISHIKKYFWDQFLLNFNPSDICSYHLVCPCHKCHITKPI